VTTCEFCKGENLRPNAKYCSKTCKSKRDAAARTPEKAKAAHVKFKYGISVEEYDALFVNAKCAICETTEKLCLDHDHNTGKIRGVLCMACNGAIGILGDSSNSLWRAYSYLTISEGEDGRPSWEQYFLGIARQVSLRGDCRRSRVGAVVVSGDQRVLGVGYNGTRGRGEPGCLSGACPRGRLSYADCPPLGSYDNCISVHAERNAIDWTVGAIGRRALIDATLYVTRGCCDGCRLYALGHGIGRIVTPDGTEDLNATRTKAVPKGWMSSTTAVWYSWEVDWQEDAIRVEQPAEEDPQQSSGALVLPVWRPRHRGGSCYPRVSGGL